MPLVSTFGNLSARAFGLGAYRSSIFSPLSLFAAGEQGVWYDPSDLTTMFEDAAGTTPVHTPGNGTADSPVGLLLDKHSGGVGTNGAACYNLLTYSEQFNNAAWGSVNLTITANQTVAPDGTTTAEMISETTANAQHSIYQNPSVVSSVNYTASVALKQGTQRYAVLSFATGSTNQVRFAAVVDLQTGTITQTNTLNSPTGTSSSISSLGSGWYRITITQDSTTAAGYLIVAMSNTGTPTTFIAGTLDPSYTGNASNNIYIWGADLRKSSQVALTPTYQPITSSWAATMAGNHATQSTSTARPTLSARYNQLTYSEQFNNAVWSKGNTTVTADATTAPDGTTTADAIYETAVNSRHYVSFQGITPNSNANYTFSVCFKAGTRTWANMYMYVAGATYYTYFDLANGVLGNNAAGTTASMTSLGNGWYRCTISRTSVNFNGVNGGGFEIATGNGTNSYLGDVTKYIYAWGAEVRATNDGVGLPVYQRIADANTYDSTGFPYYIKTDGVDDFLTAGTVNFSGTNKMSAFVGARKTSANTISCLLELTADFAATNGGFGIFAPNNTNQYETESRGTAYQSTGTTSSAYASPVTNVIGGLGDISAPSITLRLNGSQISTNTASQGTGNYANAAFFMFRRNGANYAFGGRAYGIIVRGASFTATEISNTETWLNTKTKAY